MVKDRYSEIREALANVKGVRFADLMKVCTELFGESRNSGSSHFVFKMPWPGDPRINLQADGKNAKPYQVRQVLKALDRLENENE